MLYARTVQHRRAQHIYARTHAVCTATKDIYSVVSVFVCVCDTFVYMLRMTEQYDSDGGGAFSRKGVYHIYRFNNELHRSSLRLCSSRLSSMCFARYSLAILSFAQLLFCRIIIAICHFAAIALSVVWYCLVLLLPPVCFVSCIKTQSMCLNEMK